MCGQLLSYLQRFSNYQKRINGQTCNQYEVEHPAQIMGQKAVRNCEAYVRTQVNVHELSYICMYLLGVWATNQPEMTSKLSQTWDSGTEGQSKIPKAWRSFILELKTKNPPSNYLW